MFGVSRLVSTTVLTSYYADVAQSVERILGKDKVTGSIPVISSILSNEPKVCEQSE